MVRKATLALSALALLASASAQAKGPVVAYFFGDRDEVSSMLAEDCIRRGIAIVEQSETQVICQTEMKGFSAFAAQLLIGNSYSTSPLTTIRYALAKGRNYIVVQATAWVETQMAFGQTRRQMLDGKKATRQLADALANLGGGSVPPAPEAVNAAPEAQAPEPQTATPTPVESPKPKPHVICTTCDPN